MGLTALSPWPMQVVHVLSQTSVEASVVTITWIGVNVSVSAVA